MSNFLLNIGCFKCGDESVKDFDVTFNKVSCQLCGMENNATELLIDKLYYLESKLKAQQLELETANSEIEKLKRELKELKRELKEWSKYDE